MSEIERLWGDFLLPIRDALHFPDGHSYDVTLAPETSRGLQILAPFDLNAMLASDPNWTSSVDGLNELDLEGSGFLWAGEGSYGSEGFIARLTIDRTLVWAIFFEESNPFQEIRLSGTTATFTSTSGIDITLNIDDPRNPIPDHPS
ncbi:hypothetical protein [Streptomyces sp. NBRC 110028]|uniref:hypothetical protein n=1 Tax=Streptomyces sp. NBRC 110028 TaxID=1621260 RepID=UPI00099E5178|nr:hypothetical protein [Streptomyces sp. NBRC 110028]